MDCRILGPLEVEAAGRVSALLYTGQPIGDALVRYLADIQETADGSANRNEARVRGTVRRLRPKDGDRYVDIDLEVEAIEDIEGRANLLQGRVGEELTVTADATDVSESTRSTVS
jgi:hypothetical protein